MCKLLDRIIINMHRHVKHIGKQSWSNGWSGYSREFSNVPLLSSGKMSKFFNAPPKPKARRKKIEAVNSIFGYFKNQRINNQWIKLACNAKRLLIKGLLHKLVVGYSRKNISKGIVNYSAPRSSTLSYIGLRKNRNGWIRRINERENRRFSLANKYISR